MPTFIRNAFSYLILTLAAAFTLMLFIPARYYAAPPITAIASIAHATTSVARPRHLRSWHPTTLGSVDKQTASRGMLVLMLVQTQTQGSRVSQ